MCIHHQWYRRPPPHTLPLCKFMHPHDILSRLCIIEYLRSFNVASHKACFAGSCFHIPFHTGVRSDIMLLFRGIKRQNMSAKLPVLQITAAVTGHPHTSCTVLSNPVKPAIRPAHKPTVCMKYIPFRVKKCNAVFHSCLPSFSKCAPIFMVLSVCFSISL